ncbi:hypothetical protein CsSME_00042760 [Camellia sinensis var. sinensis]
MNRSLLLKWWWRYEEEDKALWKKVINSRYGAIGGGWLPKMEPSGRVSAVWNGILYGVEIHPDLLNFFLSKAEINLGDGKRVFFWLDKWLRNMKLKDGFPRLFSLSTEKEVSLECVVQRKEGVGGWHLNFRRPLRSWEEVEVVRLYALLAEVPPLRPTIPDSLRWLRSSSGKFTVAAVREWLVAHHGPKLTIPTLLWGNVAPPKVQFLGWLI